MIYLFDVKWMKSKRFPAMCLWPFMLFATSRENTPEWLIAHERVHWWQQLVLTLPVYMLIWHGFLAWGMYVRKQPFVVAYLAIPFEKQAYAKQKSVMAGDWRRSMTEHVELARYYNEGRR